MPVGMAVNVFEELVRGALQADRYLTAENVPYRLHPDARSIRSDPARATAESDIDLIAFRPGLTGPRRVLAVNCKGGGEPLNVARDLQRLAVGNPNQYVAGSSATTGFRELTDPDWAKAFRQRVYTVTGASEFTHVLAVKKITGDRRQWVAHVPFHRLTRHLELMDLQEIFGLMRQPKARLFANSSSARLLDLIAA